MISVVLGAIVGFLAARMLWLAMRKSWNNPVLMRENFHGVSLPTSAGVVLAFTLVLVEGLRAIFGAAGLGTDGGLSPMRDAALVVVVGFTLLGLIDDLLGDSKAKGLSGHLKALASGNLTSGGVKLLGGIAVSFIGASLVGADGLFDLVVKAAVIALAANLANLFDLRPGRSTKVSVIAFVLLALASGLDQNLVSVAVVIGAAIALFLDDMHERLMLGDAGANAMGAALGLGVVATTGASASLVILVALMALTLLSEFVSFTSVFEKVGFLRSFDQIGRKSQSGSRTASQPSAGTSSKPAPQPEPFQEDPGVQDTVDVRDEVITERFVEDEPRYIEDDARYGEDDPDESNGSAMRTTVGGAHVGEPASSSSSREQSPFSSSTSRERSATRSIFAEDEFDDTPDFLSPRRSSSTAEPLPGLDQPRSPERRSPFDDDDEF